MAPPSKDATTARPSAGANANRFGLHCVGIGDLLCCAIRLCRRRTSLNQSPDAPDSCERCGLSPEKIKLARKLYADTGTSVTEICKMLGISRHTLQRYVKE